MTRQLAIRVHESRFGRNSRSAAGINKGQEMQEIDRHQANRRSDGPFVTATGRRLPVRTLSFSDVPGLVEFSDYLARRSSDSAVAGFDGTALESMTEAQFNERTTIALSAGPRPLIRAVASYTRTSGPSAEVRFTIDNSLLADSVFREMVYRIADDARDHQVTELWAAEPVTGTERDALEASGFPINTGGDGRLTVNIAEAR